MVMIVAPQGRLTPISGVAIPTANIAGVTSLFFTPCAGRSAPILTAAVWAMLDFAELTLPLSAAYHLAGTLYDAFLFGNPLKLGSAPANAPTEIVDGIEVNSGVLAVRWGTGAGDVTNVAARAATRVGAFRTTLAGETRLTNTNLDIVNLWNRVPLIRLVADQEFSWEYYGGWRSVRNGAGPRIHFIQVAPGLPIRAAYKANMTARAGESAYIGIGLDSDMPLAPIPFVNFPENPPISFPCHIEVSVMPERGYHNVRCLEYATGPAKFDGQGALSTLTLAIEG